MDAPKEIDAATLTEALLEYAFSPAGPEVQRERSYRYLEELLFLKLFSVDYVLGIRGASQAEFTPVRMLYNEGIERSSSVKGFDYRTIVARFETYTVAVNAYLDYEPEERERKGRFWDIGKAFSRLASDTEPWVPNALDVAIHGNIFASQCVRLKDFLDQYELDVH